MTGDFEQRKATTTQATIAAVLAALAGFVFAAPLARAADLTVSPAIIDDQGLPNDILNYTLTLTNTSGRLLNVYASVYEITASGSIPFADPASSDRPALLADWISVDRGAMLLSPGATETIPVGVTINPFATAGEYHAVIAFVEGDTRDEAEENLDGAPQALVDITVESNLKEELQLVSFVPEKDFYSGFPVSVDYTIKNTGDVPSTPGGDVIFYDRVGHEIGSVPVNPGGTAIAPNGTETFTASWKDGSGMGQYKAGLEATYGAQDAQLADTAVFWVLPWQKIIAIFGALLAVVIVVAVLIHRKYMEYHYQRRALIQHLMNTKHVVDLRGPERTERRK
jgi:hypothetical protein